jgi:ATP-dependent DNA helicase RecG
MSARGANLSGHCGSGASATNRRWRTTKQSGSAHPLPAAAQRRHMIPRVAVREILANAIIHQDFTISGDGPFVEVCPDRLKITNPGRPLIPVDRFIDAPSTSRNSRFGLLMRQLRICEERGSGVDRALVSIEREILPPPLFQSVENTTVVTLRPEAIC